MGFFIWNFYNRNAFPRQSFLFFTIAVILNVYYFAYFKPWSDSVQKDWKTTGYHEKFVEGSQYNLNRIARQIEAYKKEKGNYPESLNNLYELENHIVLNNDFSYMIKMDDGQVNGRSFYYEKSDNDSFYLSAVGPDGIGKSTDDIIPEIYHYELINTGLTRFKLFPISERDIKHGYSDSTINPNSIMPQ